MRSAPPSTGRWRAPPVALWPLYDPSGAVTPPTWRDGRAGLATEVPACEGVAQGGGLAASTRPAANWSPGPRRGAWPS